MILDPVSIGLNLLKKLISRKKENKASDETKQLKRKIERLERQQEERDKEPESLSTGMEGEGLLRYTRK